MGLRPFFSTFYTIFGAFPMDGKNRSYNHFHFASSIFLITALLWLTISLPFVNQAQKEQAANSASNTAKNSQQDNNNPLSNTTEEKIPSTPQEEYLHHQDEHSYTWLNSLQHFSDHTLPLYIAFHGELLSPPPEA